MVRVKEVLQREIDNGVTKRELAKPQMGQSWIATRHIRILPDVRSERSSCRPCPMTPEDG